METICRAARPRLHSVIGWARGPASRPGGYRVAVRSGAVALLCPAGCSQAPSQNIVGSFFPAWMLCAAIGLAAAAVCRVILGAVGLDKQLLAPPLGYLAVATAVTLFVWLYRFGQ